MKYLFLQVFLIISVNTAVGQLRVVEYFFDTDPGFGNADSIHMPGSPGDTTFTFHVDITPLSRGLHRLHIRTFDSSQLAWSQTTSRLFYRDLPLVFNLSNLHKAEYFFDTDPGVGRGTDIPFTQGFDVTFSFNGSTAGLTTGLHKLFIRARDLKGRWSHATPQLFYFEKSEGYVLPDIVKAEYFFDTDPGFGNGVDVPVSPGNDISFPINSSMSGMQTGLHRLFIRTLDANGKWSHSTPQLFYYEKAEGYTPSNLVKAEYFFDTDPGFGNGTDIVVTPGQDVSFAFNASATNLSTGIHRLYIRSKSSDGNWSHTTPQLLYYEKIESHIPGNLVKAEYFFDADPGFGNANSIPITPGEDILFLINGNINSLDAGLHRLSIRTQDAEGNWSHTTPQLFYREVIEQYTPGSLVKLEWFWDTDPGFGNANSVVIPGGQTDLHDFNFDVSVPGTFSNEVHNLYVRAMDDWSHTTVTKVDFTNIVLPVTLLSFSARAENERVLTSWKVTSEINMDKYVVEHSTDGIHFASIGVQPANNGGEHVVNYFLYHNNPITGINYYRLRQIDLDGTYSYSAIATVIFSKNNGKFIVYPNPASTVFSVDAEEKISEINLLDITGKKVKKYHTNRNSFSLAGVPAGTYLVQIVLENDQVIIKPIIVEK